MELLDIVKAQKNEHTLKNSLKFLMGLIWWVISFGWEEKNG